mmetsp:Transcript_17600/g.24277  ORF Transcript_17600/g.24277 Transcript_17600/m.24277 type:complete len:157 (+) Transcript_17600:1559-2029(+)
MIDSILFTVILFLFLLNFILIYSIVLSDVEERTYEFAMLRVLGFKNSSLVTLLLMQACFFAIPATALGFVMCFLLKNGAQVGLYVTAGISVPIPWTVRTVSLGIIMGIFVPLISNILPIKAALGTSLRNALDRFRPSVDEMEVQMIRMENLGISLN